jgi:phosphohistidine phosphatase
MTRTLILIRHAKSDWDDPGLDDHDRPLNDRGRLSAPRIGAWLAEQGASRPMPSCAPPRAARAKHGTASPPNFTGAAEPVFTRGLYHAAPADMLNAIRDSDAGVLAVVAHNPGIGALAWSLCSTRRNTRNSASIRRVPR